jgi:peptidoglycan/xylan/chitin deacetylase (PgdA/CDA1 family)
LSGESGAVLHSVAGPPGTRLAAWLDRSGTPFGPLRPLVGPFARPIVRVSGPDGLVEEAAQGLPSGPASAEAVAVRLRRAGVELTWGTPDLISDSRAFLRLSRERGASSVLLFRSDPSLLSEMQLGAFFHAYWRQRVARLTVCRVRALSPLLRQAGLLGLAADAAFWTGVQAEATEAEWKRLARSSYVVFYYHRIGERGKPGEERLDVHPQRFERQLRLLRLMRFKAVGPDELLRFHADPSHSLPRRSYMVTADDGFRDAVVELRRHADVRPVVFVNTSCVGGSAIWAYNEPLAAWEELEDLRAAGGVVASHCRHHPRLPELEPADLEDELAGALGELREHLSEVWPLFAYPHGLHDERTRQAVIASGYDAAFTTQPGRNGAGTDPYCLRRIGLKDWDGAVAVFWKAATGELLPWAWERARRRLLRVV